MKHMIISFEIKGYIIYDHFLMLWFKKDSLDTVGFRTYGGGSRVLKQKVTFGVLNVPRGWVTGLGQSPGKCRYLHSIEKQVELFHRAYVVDLGGFGGCCREFLKGEVSQSPTSVATGVFNCA